MKLSTIGTILCLLAIAYARPAENSAEKCTCAVFKDEQLAPGAKPLFTKVPPIPTKCGSDKIKEDCKNMCSALAAAARDEAPKIVCGILKTHVDNMKPALFYKVCGQTNWEHVATAKNAICCHEGAPRPCDGHSTAVRSYRQAKDAASVQTVDTVTHKPPNEDNEEAQHILIISIGMIHDLSVPRNPTEADSALAPIPEHHPVARSAPHQTTSASTPSPSLKKVITTGKPKTGTQSTVSPKPLTGGALEIESSISTPALDSASTKNTIKPAEKLEPSTDTVKTISTTAASVASSNTNKQDTPHPSIVLRQDQKSESSFSTPTPAPVFNTNTVKPITATTFASITNSVAPTSPPPVPSSNIKKQEPTQASTVTLVSEISTDKQCTTGVSRDVRKAEDLDDSVTTAATTPVFSTASDNSKPSETLASDTADPTSAQIPAFNKPALQTTFAPKEITDTPAASTYIRKERQDSTISPTLQDNIHRTTQTKIPTEVLIKPVSVSGTDTPIPAGQEQTTATLKVITTPANTLQITSSIRSAPST